MSGPAIALASSSGAPSLPTLLGAQWQISWPVLALAGASGLLYVAAAARVDPRWPLRRTVAFLAGLGCVLVALASGLDGYDDRMLSAHMVQHMLLLLVAPLLLLGGRPLILALRALPPGARRPFARALTWARPFTAPLPALIVFAAVLALTHLSAFYDATLRHPALHDLEHGLYLLAGLLLFTALVDGDPAARRLSGLGRLAYVIAAMVPMALIGAYLNRHATLAYPDYGPPARALGISAVDDQAQAGAIMWVAGNTIMVAVGLWTAIAAMVAEERRQRVRDARAGAPVTGAGVR